MSVDIIQTCYNIVFTIIIYFFYFFTNNARGTLAIHSLYEIQRVKRVQDGYCVTSKKRLSQYVHATHPDPSDSPQYRQLILQSS